MHSTGRVEGWLPHAGPFVKCQSGRESTARHSGKVGRRQEQKGAQGGSGDSCIGDKRNGRGTGHGCAVQAARRACSARAQAGPLPIKGLKIRVGWSANETGQDRGGRACVAAHRARAMRSRTIGGEACRKAAVWGSRRCSGAGAQQTKADRRVWPSGLMRPSSRGSRQAAEPRAAHAAPVSCASFFSSCLTCSSGRQSAGGARHAPYAQPLSPPSRVRRAAPRQPPSTRRGDTAPHQLDPHAAAA